MMVIVVGITITITIMKTTMLVTTDRETVPSEASGLFGNSWLATNPFSSSAADSAD